MTPLGARHVPFFLLPWVLFLQGCKAPAPRERPMENTLALARTFQAALLKDVLRKACPPRTRVGTWAGPAMADPIDGAAEEYLHLGALGLALAHTPSGGEILLFDMGTPEGAYGMFLSLKDPGGSIAAGLARSGGCLVARKGRFLAQFPASWNQQKARELMARLPGATTRPALFDALPSFGLVPGSERILPEDPWGFGVFRWGLSGRYGSPGLSLSLLVPEKNPRKALADLERNLRAMGAETRPDGEGFRGSARGLGSFLFLPAPGKVVAFTEIPSGLSRGKLRAWAAAARKAPPLPPRPPWLTAPPGRRPGGRKKGEAAPPYTLARVDREIGAILERFIEDPKEPLPTGDLSGPWRLQVRARFQEVECRRAPGKGGKGWDFFMKGRLGGKRWIHLERDRGRRFKGWIRPVGPKGISLQARWPFSMVLSPDGSELNGKIRPPGKKGGMDLQFVRPVHVKDYRRLKKRLQDLLAAREELLKKEKTP